MKFNDRASMTIDDARSVLIDMIRIFKNSDNYIIRSFGKSLDEKIAISN